MSASSASPRPGLDGVVAAESVLGFVDGQQGLLCIAGQPIQWWTDHHTFTELAATLLGLGAGTPAPTDLEAHLGAARVTAFHRLAPVEGWLETSDQGVAAVRGALSLVAEDDRPATILGAIAVIAAAWIRRHSGQALLPPDPTLPHTTDLLRMALGSVDSHRSRALDTYLTTVVDHGLNASTFAARVVASTAADNRAAVTAALAALEGPLHGGAPGPVLDMLDAIATPDAAEDWIRAELAAGRRIMGMGHRVYRTRDPRAEVLEQAARALPSADRGKLDLAAEVERAAARQLTERHPDRPLRANVEMGTAVLLDAIGFPRAAFTALFACSRAAAWLAHAIEQRRTGRLLRPRLRYVGAAPAA
jgi:citrate synthase